jgi:hypothetical protein
MFKHSNATSLCCYVNYEDDIDYFDSQWVVNNILLCCYLCMFRVGCKPSHVNQLNLANNMLNSS